jgi:predicted RNA-binding protein YlxR (DUF448 family)
MTPREPKPVTKRVRERTCVGCGAHDDAGADDLLRLVVADDEVAFDLAGGGFGRGAHVHARPACLEKAPRGIARAFRRDPKLGAKELAERLAHACDGRMAGLLASARRLRAVAVGADAALEVLRMADAGETREADILGIVATDAGVIAASSEVQRAAAAGRLIGWRTKDDLGALLGEHAVAICAVRHGGIAAALKRTRAAADAAAATTTMRSREAPLREARSEDRGAECSRRPEAR